MNRTGAVEVQASESAAKAAHQRFGLREVKEAVDEMIREDDYSPEDAQIRIEQLLTGRV